MSNRETLTPMLQQYMDIKENTNDALVFYRLGDFYELFFDDAIIASKVLDLVLTARSAGKDQKAPMCGVPYHAAKSYIQKLISNGYKVAIVEQVEDPKEAKGIVRREVVEIVTPGTYLDQEDTMVREIAALHTDFVYATFVMCELSSGSVRALRVMNQENEILKVIKQYGILELVVNPEIDESVIKTLQESTGVVFSKEAGRDTSVNHQDGGIQDALQRLYFYLLETQKRSLIHLSEVEVLNDSAYLRMDYATMRNLELINHESDRTLSLFSFMNRTKTMMGQKRLRLELMQPMVDIDGISQRHAHIESLLENRQIYAELQAALKDAYDIHRVLARISTGKSNAQDLVRLKKTLAVFATIQSILKGTQTFKHVLAIDPLKACYEALEHAIHDDAPVQLKEGRTIKKGVHEELDELLSITNDGKKWLLEYETTLKETTGIKNLKVGYTRAFGYYIEVSKGQTQNVDPSFGFVRKQTLTNAERYINEALQEYEMKTVRASDRILEIEGELLKGYMSYVAGFSSQIHEIGESLAHLDVIQSMTSIASLPGYVKPRITLDGDLEIVQGRHPVLETQLGSQHYVANDAHFTDANFLHILTGPNMGGKSTYMRMVAVNVILAQMGSYVPCTSFALPIIDRLFTRMGANDDILMGQSTFMIEMIEAQSALENATKNSLILFDEIGRGTATYDGMALAQAIVEYLVHTVGAKTLFSTHYHELIALENSLPGVKNIHVEVHEENEHVTFLYRIIDGGADRSYGINVARLAHLPQSVIENARLNLESLEAQRGDVQLDRKVVVVEKTSESYRKVKGMLAGIDINGMTPLEALMLLHDIKKEMGDV